MRIELTATVVINEWLRSPGRFQAGKVFVFSDDLSWKAIDGNAVAGPAGTHSGTLRVLRFAEANDAVFPVDTLLFEYEATFGLKAVTPPGGPLGAGQVTARGAWGFNHGSNQLFTPQGAPVALGQFAVTGGTGPYGEVRGQGFEADDGSGQRVAKTLEIAL
jgi:hypothetical protein